MAAGAVGICTAKLSEAETLSAEGVQKICMTTANLSKAKIQRAMNMRKKNREFIQAVDYQPNARDLSDAAKAAGVTAESSSMWPSARAAAYQQAIRRSRSRS